MTSSQLLSPADVPQRPGFSRTVSSNSVNSNASSRSTKSFSSSLFREKDKPRLYLGLYPRGGTTPTYSSQLTCDSYHWVIIIGPKSPLRSAAGKAYQLMHAPASDGTGNPFYYTETDLNDNEMQTRSLMIRIAIGKVFDEERIESLLRSMPLPSCPSTTPIHRARHNEEVNSDSESYDHSTCTYSCLQWCKAAYELLTSPSKSSSSKGPLKCYFGPEDWKDIEARARRYIKRKRTQGRFRPGGTRNYLLGGPATWNPDEISTFNFWENRETTD